VQKKTGFTLIELIAVLLIMGVVAALASLTIPRYYNGYLMARDGQSISQNAQTALTRIGLELRSLLTVSATAASPTSVSYTRLSNSTTSPTVLNNILALSNNTITLTSNGTVNTLLNNVNTFILTYYKAGTQQWVCGTDNITLLSYVVVNLGVTCSNGTVVNFSTAVSLRNNGNTGGSPPPTTSSPPPYKPCFVATAAFGRENHPVVQTLREFRDRCLRNWSIGRAFIEVYSVIGPHLADAIRNRPWACNMVQLLLFPIAGMAFFIIYLPAGLPVIFIFSWGLFKFIRHIFSRRRKIGIEILSDYKGSILIAVIATITILGLLIGSMSTFVFTSSFSQIEGYASRKAFYLAESGYRYAASQFLNAGTGSTGGAAQAANFQELSTLNQINGASAVKLGTSGADGSFALSVTPYFLVYSANYSAGATSVNLTYPGTSPPSAYSLPSTGLLDVSLNNTPNVVPYSKSGNTYTITAGGLPAPVLQYNSVRFVTNPSSAGSISVGGNLTVQNAGPFPPFNGTFRVNSTPTPYQYRAKSGNTLQNITSTTPASPGTGLPLTVATTDNIVCGEFAEIQSTGTSYSGQTQTASRSVLYYAQIGFTLQAGSSGASVITTGSSGSAGADIMGNANLASDANFSASGGNIPVGTASYTTSAGNTSLQMNTVNGYSSILGNLLGSGSWAVLPVSSTVSTNLTNAFANGSQHYYEAQVKIATGTALPYYLAGISFRVQPSGSTYYGYGLSFAYFPSNPSVYSDGIPNGVIPTDSRGNSVTQKPIILLWENTSSGFQWLAYKALPAGIVNGTTGIANWSTLLVSLEEATKGSSKYNQIRAYYGTTGKQGTGANTIPTDNNSGANPLLTSSGNPNWTPLDATASDWTAAVDNFTLVNWDRVNPSSSSTLAPASDLPSGDTAEANCVIEDSTFVTSSSEALYSPEILLNVAGSGSGNSSISVGFDDFAIYAPAGANIGFTNPIQQ
jgi:prepilin-type N-terminal cleavage/methylation domain-containing protein